MVNNMCENTHLKFQVPGAFLAEIYMGSRKIDVKKLAS